MDISSIADAAGVVRGRRLELGLTQEGLAERAGISRKWIYEFEAGKSTAELGHLLRVLQALGLSLSTQDVEKRPSPVVNLEDLLQQHRR